MIQLKVFLSDFAVNPKNLRPIEAYYQRGKFMLGITTYVTLDRKGNPIITNRLY